MPNHVKNILTTNPDVIAAMMTTFEDGSTGVDFAKVVPTPKGYISGGCSHQHPLFFSTDDPDWKCWYSWNRQFWGTKWNGYSAEVTELSDGKAVLTFETAWSHPAPVIEELSRKFPRTRITVQYADEDFGSNLGTYVIQGGARLVENFPAPGSEEANEMAAQIRYGRPYAELKVEWDAEERESAIRYRAQRTLAVAKGLATDGDWKTIFEVWEAASEDERKPFLTAAQNYYETHSEFDEKDR